MRVMREPLAQPNHESPESRFSHVSLSAPPAPRADEQARVRRTMSAFEPQQHGSESAVVHAGRPGH